MIKYFKKKLTGQALYFALLISMIIGSIAAGFLVYFYKIGEVEVILKRQNKAFHDLRSGVTILLNNPKFGTYKLHEHAIDSIKLEQVPYGYFDVFKCSSTFKPELNKLIFVRGCVLPDYCLYLADDKKHLTIIGKTELKGNVYVPKIGIRSGHFQRRGYQGKQLVYDGEINTSTNQLPNCFIKYRTPNSTPNSSNIYSNSFDKETLREDVSLLTTSTHFEGNFIFEGDSVFISKNCSLTNCIIKARKIVIEQGFKGSAQFIAQESIEVGDDCLFDYPSLLIVEESSEGKITIGNATVIRGAVIVEDTDPIDRKNGLMEFGDNSQIYGMIYSNSDISLKGNVKGLVQTTRFIRKEESSFLVNSLIDVKINRNEVDQYFLSPIITGEEKQKFGVLQWLD